MKGMSKFQLILTGIFGVFIVIGVLVFAFARGGSSNTVAKATIWGTMNESLFNAFMLEAGLREDKTISVTYVQKDSATFDQNFVEALAVGQGPDLFFLPQDSILKHQSKILTIPFDSYPERTFKDTFVQEGELYLTQEGVLGLPFAVDPMVMYWNRDMFSNAGLSVPPKSWSEFYDLSTKLTVKDTNLNVTKSAFALGEYGNISHANELISLLVMQAGNSITSRSQNDDSIQNHFSQRFDFPVAPALRAVNFYTEFSNPLKPFYSWNRSLPESKSLFLSGDLGLYFGFASELADIRQKNPNLNFGVSSVPQSANSNLNITYGRMLALAIPRNSLNVASAFKVATVLTNASSITALSKVTNLPPVRRDLLTTRPPEAFLSLFYDGAVQARAWLSPEPAKLSPIFKEMIESITGGRTSPEQGISGATQQLDVVLQ